MVYDPLDDSWLLAESVKKFARGRVLDMGTGSGFQAVTAARIKKVKEVLAVDIDPEAINYSKKNSFHEKVIYQLSDLFENIQDKFDTIIFNPPYLPTKGKKIEHLALEGGKKGYEVIEKFLNSANQHLKISGTILLLFSSHSKQKMINKILEDNLLVFQQIALKKMFQEQLFVYKIQKSTLLRILEAKDVSDVNYLNRGKRGLIYTGQLNDEKVSIKVKHPQSKAINRIKHEGDMLTILNKENIGPKLIFYDEDMLIYEFVQGQIIKDFLLTAARPQLTHVLRTILDQCFTLDQLQISKEEMTNPYKHIIVGKSAKNITMLDFERANKDLHPHNVTQFCQYILHIANTASQLKKLKFKVNKKELITLTKEYKHNQSKKNFLKIRKLII